MKAMIMDLDRTLLHTDKTISEYTVHILQECRHRGIALIAATARPERAILEYREKIPFHAAVTLNGARILLPGNILENWIPAGSGEKILAKLMDMENIVISLETSEGIYSNVPIPEWDPILYNGFPKLPDQGRLYKILVSGKGDFCGGQIQSLLTEDTYYTIANEYLIQIMSKGATKWNGVKETLATLEISPKDAVYFGDDYDDLEPIRLCGVGVAVSNAIQAALEAADDVAGSNDDDGVAHYIEKHFL